MLSELTFALLIGPKVCCYARGTAKQAFHRGRAIQSVHNQLQSFLGYETHGNNEEQSHFISFGLVSKTRVWNSDAVLIPIPIEFHSDIRLDPETSLDIKWSTFQTWQEHDVESNHNCKMSSIMVAARDEIWSVWMDSMFTCTHESICSPVCNLIFEQSLSASAALGSDELSFNSGVGWLHARC